MSSYRKIVTFGNSVANSLPVYNNDPLTMCIGNSASQRFNHGSAADTYGQNSAPCQAYLSQRCARNWDGICEYATSQAANAEYQTRANTLGAGSKDVIYLTPAEILLRNTAHERFRTGMLNCTRKTEPFNPMDPNSRMISYYVGDGCVPIYEILHPSRIDKDIVMNRILDRPQIAQQMLLNIRNTMQRKGTLHTLRGTRLGAFFGLSGGKSPKGARSKEGYRLPRRQALFNWSPYVVPTKSGYVGSKASNRWPLEYIDYWPNEYDGAWVGSKGAVRY